MRKSMFGLVCVLTLATGVTAAPIYYAAVLTGAAEAPPNASPGIGVGTVMIDTAADLLDVDFSFSGLIGTTTAMHIHCCTAVPFTGTAGVATATPTFPGSPLGVTSGAYDVAPFSTALASTFRAGFITANGGTVAGAEAALAAGLAGGQAYLNIHSTAFPAGEIRGFLVLAPEPSTYLLAGGALALLGLLRRARGTSRR